MFKYIIILILVSILNSQPAIKINYLSTGTPILHLKVNPTDSTIWSCFNQKSYPEIIQDVVDYDWMDSLVTITEHQNQLCSQNDSLHTLNENKLKVQADTLLHKYDQSSKDVQSLKISRIKVALETFGLGFIVGVVTWIWITK